jgi:hypothetical protein
MLEVHTMKQRLFIATSAALLAGVGSSPVLGQENQAAQVIFTTSALTVIDAKGIERQVKQGDFVHPNERVLTPPGTMGQIKLPDGTLLGARPGADFKIDPSIKALEKNSITLNEGKLRVINLAPPKGLPPRPVDVISPMATLKLQAGDGEAIHVKQGGKTGAEPGTYSRMQIGVATVQNATKSEMPLTPMQPSFAPKSDAPPVQITMLPPSLAAVEPIKPSAGSTTSSVPVPVGMTAIKPLPPIGAPPIGPSPQPPVFYNMTPLSPGAVAMVPVQTINTAVVLKPPAPLPPPPPKVITCKTCLILKK